MKNLLIVFLLLLVATTAGAQHDDNRIIALLTSDTLDEAEIKEVIAALQQEGNPYAALSLLEATKANVAVQPLNWMINPELPFENSTTIEIATSHGDWNALLKKIKKVKEKKAILDSLQHVPASDFWQKVQKGRQLTSISKLLKKNTLETYYDSLMVAYASNSFQYEVVLRDAINAASSNKNKRKLQTLQQLQADLLQSYENKRNDFFQALAINLGEVSKEIRADEKSKWYKEEPVKEKVTPRETIMAIVFGVLALVLLIFYFILQDRYKTKLEVIQQKMQEHKKIAEAHEETYAQVKAKAEVKIEETRRLYAGKEEDYLRIIKEANEGKNEIKRELHDLQLEAKQSMDKLAKENSPQHWMELQNLISRKLNQLRERL